MKKILFSFSILLSCLTAVYAQRFQATTGTSFTEDKWAVIEDAAIGRFVTIGNASNSDNFSRIWIASYTPAGNMITSAISTNNRKIIARDICLAPPDSTNTAFRNTYYITGWTINNSGTNQMFVARINLSGAMLWYRESPGATVQANGEEGVAIAMAPNGDAVAAGHAIVPLTGNTPSGSRVKLARFSAAGATLWTNVYNTSGNWKVRELANGTPTPNCIPSPATMPGDFIITGEVSFPPVTGGVSQPHTFAATYNGAGNECWRRLYPATVTSSSPNIVADAGYDVVLRPNGNYVIAGVAQMGSVRASNTSTPYFVEVTSSGALITSAVYLKKDSTALGIYPRCISRAQSTVQLVCAGPDYGNNNTFGMRIVNVGAAAVINRFPGVATANSVAQPFLLDNAQPEGILYTTMGTPGYLISTNAIPGPFGNGDGHLIKSDVFLRTPTACPNVDIQHIARQVGSTEAVTSTPIAMQWGFGQLANSSYAVQQKFCRDTCTVTSAYTFVQSGNAVNFTGSGTGNGTLSYSWNFGDGSISNMQNPSHTYINSGTYNACLTVTNVNGSGDSCKSTTCRTITIGGTICDVKASFRDSLSCRYKVSFTNTSTGTGPLVYFWSFDDSMTSTVKDPVITFSRCGAHVIRLIVCNNNNCCDTIVKTIIIPCCEVKSTFCIQDSGRFVKLIYDPAMNPTGTTYTVYYDGAVISWPPNTIKTPSPGVHTICVKASRSICPGDTCCSTCCKTFSVSTPCTLAADFWYQVQSGGTVAFTNRTTPGGFSSEWNFGDGTPSIVTTTPNHTYAAPGTYLVCLTATIISGNDTCIGRVCKILIIEAPCKPLANFMTKLCSGSPLTVEFTNLSTTGTTVMWNFGDGTISNDQNPSHTYSSIGSYTVCVTASFSNNCWSRTCYRVIVSSTSCDTSCSQLPPPPVYTRGSQRLESSVSSSNGLLKDNTQALRKKLAETTAKDKLTLYPNPASQKVNVVFETASETSAEVTVISSLGSIVYRKTVALNDGKNQFSIPIQSLANGNYFLKLNSGEKIQSSMFSVKK